MEEMINRQQREYGKAPEISMDTRAAGVYHMKVEILRDGRYITRIPCAGHGRKILRQGEYNPGDHWFLEVWHDAAGNIVRKFKAHRY